MRIYDSGITVKKSISYRESLIKYFQVVVVP